MRKIINPPGTTWESLCKRPLAEKAGLETAVKEILEEVRIRGDQALTELTKKFDGVDIKDISVSRNEMLDAERSVSPQLKGFIRIASSNIEKFHRSQVTSEPVVETSAGVRCWRKSVPVGIAGLYIPGGSAPLFSSVLMLAIPAVIAGCSKVVMCTPPGPDGKIDPLILYAAKLSGVTNVFRTGGAQAIAAMAYGTVTIPAVDKIFGPGNQFVTMAKQLVQMEGVPIDMPAGPSEVLVIADSTADPSFVAADLLSQAEHGPDSQVVFLTDQAELIPKVEKEIAEQVQLLPRRETALKSLESSLIIQLPSLRACLEFSNLYAPEHLIISTSNATELSDGVTNAGSVFIGKYSCESAGDYATGTNHTLPTNGYARNYSGASVDSFIKKITFQEVTPAGLKTIGPVVAGMAEAEHLDAHKSAVLIRLKSFEND